LAGSSDGAAARSLAGRIVVEVAVVAMGGGSGGGGGGGYGTYDLLLNHLKIFFYFPRHCHLLNNSIGTVRWENEIKIKEKRELFVYENSSFDKIDFGFGVSLKQITLAIFTGCLN